jgi:hypothetical protein
MKTTWCSNPSILVRSRRIGRGAGLVAALFAASLLAGGPARADDMVRYSVPASEQGVRGDATVTFHGWAGPRYRFNFQTNAVFNDPDLPGLAIMVAKTGDNQIDPATGSEQAGSDTHEVVVGLSADNGDTFSFHRVLKWTNGKRLVRIAMVPDLRQGRFQVWTGIAQVWENIVDSVQEHFLGSTRIEIDWSTKKVRLLDQDGAGWDEYPFGTVNPPLPGYFSTSHQFTHLARVNVNNQWRYEAWTSIPVNPVAANKPNPCANLSVYSQNTLGTWDQKGRRIGWARFNLEDGVNLNSWKLIDSTVRNLPTSYQRSDQQVIRGEINDVEFLYVGTQDQIACTEQVFQNSDGTSVRFIKLQYNPVTDNYTEVEHDYVLDISSPTSPNWSCADPNVRCYGTSRRNYDNVNAIPYRDGNRFQLYVGAWGTAAPTFPAIGEAGQVTVNDTSVKTVNLTRAYNSPVVFVQPPSYQTGRPIIARVSNVTASSFKVRLQKDSGLATTHGNETVFYVVLEEGTYRLLDKRVLEVAKLSVATTIPGTVSWTSELDLKDSHDNDTGAVIFTQLQSMNDPYYAKTRHTGVPAISTQTRMNTVGISGPVRLATTQFGIERDEASKNAGQPHGATEQVGVLVIGEKWIGRGSSVFRLGPWGAEGFDVRRVSGVGGVVNLGWTSITFQQPHGTNGLSNPVLLAWSETRNGGDPANVRYRNLTSTGVDLAMDEDQSADPERDHGGETVIYWVFGKGTGIIRAEPIEPEADRMF